MFEVANGEEIYDKGVKFDRIIANLVIMFVPDPDRMMKNLASVAKEGCLMGITIWGDPTKNNKLAVMPSSLK